MACTVFTSPMNQRARSKSWMPMSRIIPPLLFGSAYSRRRCGRDRARCDLKSTGVPIAPSAQLLLGRRVAGVEAAHEAHLEEDARPLDRLLHGARLGERQGRRLLAEDGLAALRPRRSPGRGACAWGSRSPPRPRRVSSSTACGSARPARAPRSPRPTSAARPRRGVRDGHEARLRDAGGQVAGVDPAEAAQADEADAQLARAAWPSSAPRAARAPSSRARCARAGPGAPSRPSGA